MLVIRIRGHVALAVVLLSLSASRASAQDLGTRPGELTQDLRTSHVCNGCHGAYADYAADDTWRGSMMANAARDPLFHAALTIANQDIPGSGEMCIRCHSPRAYLFGRADPPDATALEPDDFDSINCDFCHRLVEGPDGIRPIGMGQYFVADDVVRRGPIRETVAPHETAYSEYHRDSALCGLCHDVSNPFRGGFPIERTYTEWLSSAYPAEGWSCMSCHLPGEPGTAAGARGLPNRIVHRHELAGGNTWMPLVLAAEHPELERDAAYRATSEAARRQLQESSAEIGIVAPAESTAGDALDIVVRVENQTGHKLPTGYTEGRLCWLEVTVDDADGERILHSGAYDPDAGRRVSRDADPQLRTYEARTSAGGVEGFHFVLQDGVIEDTRIPPRGFVPDDETIPVGRDYPMQPDGTLAHWDEAPYRIAIPRGARGPLTIRATLWYQTASREYVEFLRDDNHTDDNGRHMFDLWERHGRSPPVDMVASTVTVEVRPAPDGGCSVTGSSQSYGRFSTASLSMVLALCFARRRRTRRYLGG